MYTHTHTHVYVYTHTLIHTYIYIYIYVPYSQLRLCAKWTYNVHYYRLYKEHRNLGIRKHITTSCSGGPP